MLTDRDAAPTCGTKLHQVWQYCAHARATKFQLCGGHRRILRWKHLLNGIDSGNDSPFLWAIASDKGTGILGEEYGVVKHH